MKRQLLIIWDIQMNIYQEMREINKNAKKNFVFRRLGFYITSLKKISDYENGHGHDHEFTRKR